MNIQGAPIRISGTTRQKVGYIKTIYIHWLLILGALREMNCVSRFLITFRFYFKRLSMFLKQLANLNNSKCFCFQLSINLVFVKIPTIQGLIPVSLKLCLTAFTKTTAIFQCLIWKFLITKCLIATSVKT